MEHATDRGGSDHPGSRARRAHTPDSDTDLGLYYRPPLDVAALADRLVVLDYFRRSGADPDPRMAEAVQVVRSKRQPDGRWLLDRIHPGRVHFDFEGGVGTPSRWNTLRALRVINWWDGAA